MGLGGNVNASREQGLSRIRRAASMVELRMRLARVVRVLPFVLIGSFIVAAATLAARKLLFTHFSEARARQVLIATAALAVITLIATALRRLPPRAGSIALDRSHHLSDRLTSALAFAALGPSERTPMMDVAIDDACAHTTNLASSKAAPIRAPWEMLVALVLVLPLAALALLEIRIAVPVAAPTAKTIDAPPMSPDDIELFKEAARELEKQNTSPEMKAAIDKFNQLIEDLANKRLDRTEAFRRMEELERDLMKGAEADAKKLEEELKKTGMELSKSDLAKPIGDALQKKDLEKAKKEMHALAEQLKAGKKIDKASLDRLKKAMEAAAKQRKESLASINEKRQELRDEILKKKEEKKKKDDPDAGAKEKDDAEEQLIKNKERELEKLDREAEQQERAGRQLDRLDRDLAKAAADLAKELGLSAEDMEKAAEDINRMQQDEMSDKDKEELRKRLQELRELLRQQGQAGKERMKRMMKFGKRARGQSGQQGQGQGQQGQGQGQDGEDGEDGEQKTGQNGQGQGQQGQGQGKTLTLGAGQGQGQGAGDSPGAGAGQGQGQNGGPADGPPGGQGWGVGHDANVKGDRTDLKSSTNATRAEAQDTGQGPSNSEVILAAAERGFKGGPYKKVYKDYRTYAEQEINKDEIPDGYRFYVRRYFQLIRPRE
jgi:hypothetical protein